MNLMIATRLQQLRKSNGYSQDVLAEKIGVSRQSISKWERAESSPETDNLIALAELYGMTLDELLNTSGDVVKISTHNKKNKDFSGKLKSLISKANDFGIYPKTAKNMIKFPFPIIIALIYVAGSFMFDIWHPLWIIFLTIPIYYRFALACKANNKKVFNLLIPVPEIITTVFFILGFTVGQWKYIWILFLLIPIYYWMIIAFTKAE